MSSYPAEPEKAYNVESGSNGSPNYDEYDEKHLGLPMDHPSGDVVQTGQQHELHRALKGRHMQMIAIGQ